MTHFFNLIYTYLYACLRSRQYFFFPSYHKKEIITQQVKKNFYTHIYITPTTSKQAA